MPCDEIIVVSVDNTTSTLHVLSFAGTAAGNVPPLRNIEGPAANLSGATNVAYDPFHETIYVTEESVQRNPGKCPGIPARQTAMSHRRGLSPVPAPRRSVICSHGVAVTDAHIFKNGFE